MPGWKQQLICQYANICDCKFYINILAHLLLIPTCLQKAAKPVQPVYSPCVSIDSSIQPSYNMQHMYDHVTHVKDSTFFVLQPHATQSESHDTNQTRYFICLLCHSNTSGKCSLNQTQLSPPSQMYSSPSKPNILLQKVPAERCARFQ